MSVFKSLARLFSPHTTPSTPSTDPADTSLAQTIFTPEQAVTFTASVAPFIPPGRHSTIKKRNIFSRRSINHKRRNAKSIFEIDENDMPPFPGPLNTPAAAADDYSNPPSGEEAEEPVDPPKQDPEQHIPDNLSSPSSGLKKERGTWKLSLSRPFHRRRAGDKDTKEEERKDQERREDQPEEGSGSAAADTAFADLPESSADEVSEDNKTTLRKHSFRHWLFGTSSRRRSKKSARSFSNLEQPVISESFVCEAADTRSESATQLLYHDIAQISLSEIGIDPNSLARYQNILYQTCSENLSLNFTPIEDGNWVYSSSSAPEADDFFNADDEFISQLEEHLRQTLSKSYAGAQILCDPALLLSREEIPQDPADAVFVTDCASKWPRARFVPELRDPIEEVEEETDEWEEKEWERKRRLIERNMSIVESCVGDLEGDCAEVDMEIVNDDSSEHSSDSSAVGTSPDTALGDDSVKQQDISGVDRSLLSLGFISVPEAQHLMAQTAANADADSELADETTDDPLTNDISHIISPDLISGFKWFKYSSSSLPSTAEPIIPRRSLPDRITDASVEISDRDHRAIDRVVAERGKESFSGSEDEDEDSSFSAKSLGAVVSEFIQKHARGGAVCLSEVRSDGVPAVSEIGGRVVTADNSFAAAAAAAAAAVVDEEASPSETELKTCADLGDKLQEMKVHLGSPSMPSSSYWDSLATYFGSQRRRRVSAQMQDTEHADETTQHRKQEFSFSSDEFANVTDIDDEDEDDESLQHEIQNDADTATTTPLLASTTSPAHAVRGAITYYREKCNASFYN
ncbi:hypothetical protein BZA70DRAFT_60992 [Myxozyma melibiosi]|uniref:Uncharacterized protein n=1 Tax=Myxozyma melibiosi TaxID=54550 RepID=A0ABR1F1U2_9ASCO